MQEVLAYCKALDNELLPDEFHVVVKLSKEFVRAVAEYRENESATDPAEG